MKECKILKGVLSINDVLLDPLNSPALIDFTGFNCNPPLAAIINSPLPIKNTVIDKAIDFKVVFIFVFGIFRN